MQGHFADLFLSDAVVQGSTNVSLELVRAVEGDQIGYCD